MEMAISSLIRLKTPSLTGATFRPKREVNINKDGSDRPLNRDVSVSLKSNEDTSSLNKNKVDYQVNLKTNELEIRVVDSESGEVIRQTSGEEFLKLTSRITDFNQQILNDFV